MGPQKQRATNSKYSLGAGKNEEKEQNEKKKPLSSILNFNTDHPQVEKLISSENRISKAKGSHKKAKLGKKQKFLLFHAHFSRATKQKESGELTGGRRLSGNGDEKGTRQCPLKSENKERDGEGGSDAVLRSGKEEEEEEGGRRRRSEREVGREPYPYGEKCGGGRGKGVPRFFKCGAEE